MSINRTRRGVSRQGRDGRGVNTELVQQGLRGVHALHLAPLRAGEVHLRGGVPDARRHRGVVDVVQLVHHFLMGQGQRVHGRVDERVQIPAGGFVGHFGDPDEGEFLEGKEPLEDVRRLRRRDDLAEHPPHGDTACTGNDDAIVAFDVFQGGNVALLVWHREVR